MRGWCPAMLLLCEEMGEFVYTLNLRLKSVANMPPKSTPSSRGWNQSRREVMCN